MGTHIYQQQTGKIREQEIVTLITEWKICVCVCFKVLECIAKEIQAE